MDKARIIGTHDFGEVSPNFGGNKVICSKIEMGESGK